MRFSSKTMDLSFGDNVWPISHNLGSFGALNVSLGLANVCLRLASWADGCQRDEKEVFQTGANGASRGTPKDERDAMWQTKK